MAQFCQTDEGIVCLYSGNVSNGKVVKCQHF